MRGCACCSNLYQYPAPSCPSFVSALVTPVGARKLACCARLQQRAFAGKLKRMCASRCAAGADVPGQQPPAASAGGHGAVPRPPVVGMQPQEGTDQTYGELGQGLYAGTEIGANIRIHPSRTFLPGQTYTPEVRAAAASCVCSRAHHACPEPILCMCVHVLHLC